MFQNSEKPLYKIIPFYLTLQACRSEFSTSTKVDFQKHLRTEKRKDREIHFIKVPVLLSRIYVLVKKFTTYIFQGIFGKTAIWKFRKISRKT